jgi:alkylation response protein AidB-like acyl-CoA dehydrogenase
MTYTPPIEDQKFILNHTIGLNALKALPNQDDLDGDIVEAVLEEAGKLARDVLAPLNWTGDQNGTTRDTDGSVTTAKGWVDAYNAYRDGGWNSVPFDPAHGGQGLPWTLAFCVQEMWQGANISFGLCPLLNQGAIEAIEAHGSDEQKSFYLPKMISGEWTGTMNLTEPQAGSDLAAVKSKAEPHADG